MITVNTSYQIAPWADAIFAIDNEWWKKYIGDVIYQFSGRRFSSNNCAQVQKIKIETYGNSGAAAISLAAKIKAKKIVLLGYDCKYSETGKRHWHGDHPAGLGNARNISNWFERFNQLAKDFPNTEIINASRDTALECFKRQLLDEALCL